MPVIVRLADDGSSRITEVLALAGDDNLIGRGVGVHISVVDETVSRMHARLHRAAGGWLLSTLNPSNPVRVEGQPVQKVELASGTHFELGRVRFRFEAQDPRRMATVMPPEPAGVRAPPATSSGPAMQPGEPWRAPQAGAQLEPPDFEAAPSPEMPLRIEPQAAQGSWQASPPDSVSVPTAAQARVQAQGLEAMPPPLGAPGRSGVNRLRGLHDTLDESRREMLSARPPRRWPWILVGIAISLGSAGIVFHERVGEFLQRKGVLDAPDDTEARDAASSTSGP